MAHKSDVRKAAQLLGRLGGRKGGKAKSPRKATACRANGLLVRKRSLLSDPEVAAMRLLASRGTTVTDLARQYGVSVSSVSRILSKQRRA